MEADVSKVIAGHAADFPEGQGKIVVLHKKPLAIYRFQGKLGCLHNTCLHVGGPVGAGTIKDGRVYCPWHHWDFDFQTGAGFGKENIGSYKIWEEADTVYVDLSAPLVARQAAPAHEKIRIEPAARTDGKIRILGISTTNMPAQFPRHSTSEYVLAETLKTFSSDQYETKMLKLRDLKIKPCEGYYSIDKQACSWPCSITEADGTDDMITVYRGLVEWCDIVVLASPIRWNASSSLYYKMQERLNTLQNQITLHNRVLINNKAACFIITGGQDGVQALAGQMLMFFSELGFTFGQFPFVGWSRGWYNEDMKTNFPAVAHSDLVQEAHSMVERAVHLIKIYRTGHASGSHKQHK